MLFSVSTPKNLKYGVRFVFDTLPDTIAFDGLSSYIPFGIIYSKFDKPAFEKGWVFQISVYPFTLLIGGS